MSWWGRYIGLPFDDAHCWELVRRVYADQRRIALPFYGEVDARDLASVARTIEAGQGGDHWQPVAQPQLFDVALMRGRSRIWHVGVMVDARRVLHTEQATDAVVIAVRDPAISGRIIGYRRYVA